MSCQRAKLLLLLDSSLTYSIVSILLKPAHVIAISWLQRCMRVGDLFVRTTTAVSIISVSMAVLALSVALPVKMFLAPKKPQDMVRKLSNSSLCFMHQSNTVAD
jgi:hypothetical protein